MEAFGADSVDVSIWELHFSLSHLESCVPRTGPYPTAKRDPAHRWCAWWPDGQRTENTTSRFHPWRGQEMLSERTAVSSSTGEWGELFLSHLEPHRHIRCETYPRKYRLRCRSNGAQCAQNFLLRYLQPKPYASAREPVQIRDGQNW